MRLFKFIIIILTFCFHFGCEEEVETSQSQRVPELDLRGAMGGDPESSSRGGAESPPSNSSIRCARPFTYRAIDRVPSSVRVAGSFESAPWSGSLNLSDENGDGTWVGMLEISEGSHQYKLIIDEEWGLDPNAIETSDDGFGGLNGVFSHRCPYEAQCVEDSDCESLEETPICQGLHCQADERPLRCTLCPEGDLCDPSTLACVPPPTPECDDSRPCDPPLICKEELCVPECQSDEECEEGDLCVELSCVTPECREDTDCDLLEESCESLSCVPRPCSEQLFIFDPNGRDYDSVHLAGDFNEWAPTISEGGWEMNRLPDGIYYTRHALENGTYSYKIVLTLGENQEWIEDPRQEIRVDDDFGGFNSLLTVDCQEVNPQGSACGDLTSFQWSDSVMYFVMVDRFYNSDELTDWVSNASSGDATTGASGQYEGGDISGVEEKLPYLHDLGVNTVWLSAPYENRDASGQAINPNADPHQYSAYHGYWPSPQNIDYSDPMNPDPEPEVESRIGSSESLTSFVQSAHTTGVKVLFDYVMNHVDSDSQLYMNHRDWFARRESGEIALCGPENLWDDSYWGTRCAFTDYLPPFDFEIEEARTWSVMDALWWAERYQIDGYRLDAIKHVPRSWLRDLRRALNQRIEDPVDGRFYLVGETFAYDDAELIRSFVDPETMLDGQFDFPYKARLCEALFRTDTRLGDFADWMNDNEIFYGPESLMTTWIGNHDIPRAIHFASGEIRDCRQGSHPGNGWTQNYAQPTDAAPYERLGLAFTVMMTNPGIPLIYYGDEIGLAGGGDPDNRRMMPWGEDALNPHQVALRAQVRRLGQLRATHLVLARGRRINLSKGIHTWVYRMTGCGGATPDLTIAINRADLSQEVNIPAGQYIDLMTDQMIEGGLLSIPPRSALILKPAS